MHHPRREVDLAARDAVLARLGDRPGAMAAENAQHRPGVDHRAAGLVLRQSEVLEFGAKRRRLPQRLGRKTGRCRPGWGIDQGDPG